ncbi:putative F-box protein At1g47790 [Papaver somniferum]|uniref:putative F-box protein At1g47790 n=1 Tax=Papaver somniferum TaxID=3469 RepID=UPI000E7051DF|nr:putative F-box protein At1g47790 [Papaver somniferum]
MKRNRDCSVDVIRAPFSLLDGHTLCDILVRLPVKSLLQAKRVCKHWRSLVRDPYFVDLHYTRSKTCPKLLIFASRSVGMFLFSVDLFEGRVLLDQMKVELPLGVAVLVLVQILNAVNGLVCFKGSMGEVLIYNPSTGDKTSWIGSRVPWEKKHRSKSPFYGFGFDSETKEHRVVCLWHAYDLRYETGDSDFCEVLTVGKNTWRRIDDVPHYKAYGESVYVHGVVYWLSTYQHFDCSYSADAKFIVAFDIGREKFRLIRIRDLIADGRQGYNNCHDLLVIDGCVGLLGRKLIVDGNNKNVINMWIFLETHGPLARVGLPKAYKLYIMEDLGDVGLFLTPPSNSRGSSLNTPWT